MARRGRQSTRCAPGFPVAFAALLWAGTASAQQAEDAPPPGEKADGQAIVVEGRRGSAVTDVLPVAELDTGAIEAIGASNMSELLQAIRGVTQSADGSEPIFLLNAQRVSGYQEIGSLPPEAIEKVEVLPEQAALKFGFPPTRRVVNFITKRNFRQIELRGSTGTTTRTGSATEKANVGLTQLKAGRRLTLGLELRHTDALFQSDRDVLPDPEVPFDTIGNLTGVGGGEIDPALSAAAGKPVTIAPVPAAAADRNSLSGYAAGANRPRLSDLGPYRTLAPESEGIKAEAVVADRITAGIAGSLSLSAEQSRSRSIAGPASARLLVPAGNPHSPFAGPVVLNRYVTEAEPMRSRETVTTLHAGVTLRGAIAGWRWDLTGSLDQKQANGVGDRGIDPAAANAAIAAGTDPFAPLEPALVSARLTDTTRLRTRNAGAKTVVTNTPVRLPAGRVTVTATAEAERASADSVSRGPNPSELQLARTRVEGGLAVDVPIASRREKILSLIGDLSVNASVNARRVGGFGSLNDSSFGVAWSPIEDVQLLATLRRSAAAPDMERQSAPVTSIANVPVFDFGSGTTELVTLIRGGNPDLAAERRLTRTLTANWKPFAKSQLRLAATWERTTIRDQTGTIWAVTPQTEAVLPDLFVRDPAGRLLSVAYRAINFEIEEQETLSLTINAFGQIGKPPPPLPPGSKDKPPPRANYWAGIGPSLKLRDTVQLRPGTPVFDLLAGDTIYGNGTARVTVYAYGGFNYQGIGGNLSAWYSAASRVRSADPAADLRFGSVFKLNVAAYMPLHRLLRHEAWTKKLQMRLEVSNLTDARPRITDGNGAVPFRHQSDLTDPIGRTVTLSLRKLF